jgi:hypothetical protein
LQYKPKYGYKPFPNWLTPLTHFVYFGGFCIFPQHARGTIVWSSFGHPSVLLRSSFGHPRRSNKSPAIAGRSLLCCYSSYQGLSNQLLINTCKETEFLDRNELELLFLKYGAHSLNQSLCSADFTANNVHDIPGINNNSLRYVLFQKHEPDLNSLYKINTTAMGYRRREKI